MSYRPTEEEVKNEKSLKALVALLEDRKRWSMGDWGVVHPDVQQKLDEANAQLLALKLSRP